MFLLRAGLALSGLLVSAGAGLQVFVSQHFTIAQQYRAGYCQLYLCDENSLIEYGYQQQLQGGAAVTNAIGVIRSSLARDPASAQRWADLGEVLADTGAMTQAKYCVTRSLELAGDSARVLLAAGDFYLGNGERRRGLDLLRRTLLLTPAFNDAAFSYLRAHDVGVAEALQYGVPRERGPAQAYLRYLLQRGESANARTVWEWIVEGQFGDRKIAAEYTNFLFAHKRFDEAAEVWRSQQSGGGGEPNEYVFDGDFASEPDAPTSFDWRIAPADHVKIERECGDAGSGCSVRVEFDGTENVDFRNVTQFVVLPPGGYRLQAAVKAEGITTDQGPVLQVADGENQGRLKAESAASTGTSGWQQVEIPFEVTAATPYVEVSVVRHRSLRFDSRISGSFRIRRVSITSMR